MSLSNLQYSAEPIEAWIVDEATGKPLEGAIVVAHWQLTRGSLGGGEAPVGTMMVMETVTDANGRFSFPEWGPLSNPTAPDGRLTNRDPVLYVFKPGHGFSELRNKTYDTVYKPNRSLSEILNNTDETKPSRRKFDRNGERIPLKQFEGSRERYARYVADRSADLNSDLKWGKDCGFMKTPKMAIAFDRENSLLMREGYQMGAFRFERFTKRNFDECQIGEFLRGQR